MTRLESTKQINKLKMSAIRNGGYTKHASKIIEACAIHNTTFGFDLTPQQLTPQQPFSGGNFPGQAIKIN